MTLRVSFSADRHGRRAMDGIAVVLVGISAALLLLILYVGMALNRAADRTDAAAIDAGLSALVGRVLTEQRSLALWSQTAHAARGVGDPGALDRDIGRFLTEGYGHDQVFLLDGGDRVLYGYGSGTPLPASEFRGLGRAAAAMVRQVRTGERAPGVVRDTGFGDDQRRFSTYRVNPVTRWAGHLIATANGSAVVAMVDLPSASTSAPAGPGAARPPILVSVVWVDNLELARLGASLKIDRVKLVSAPGAFPLRADDGRIVGSLEWVKRRPGTAMLARVLPLAVLVLFAAGIYTGTIFRRLRAAYHKLEEQEAQARHLAMHDPLSGLANRRRFTQELERRLSAESPGRACVAYIDLDRFKELNDDIGHGGGDALVAQIGPRLSTLLRPEDLLARIGGDEFAVIRTLGEDDLPDALGELLVAGFKEPFAVEGNMARVTASIGIASAETGQADPDELLSHADMSLYRAKREGGARYVLFLPEMTDAIREKNEIENELRGAIGSKQLSMYYQPITSIRSGAITGFEALVRWKHPKWGPMSPARFIPVAEQSGLMAALGEDILRRVFKEAAALRNVDVAVNLSPIQLRDRGLPEFLGELATRHRVDPRRVVLEVTETVLIDRDGVAEEVIQALSRRGFKIALDDFGTGYSSLSYLQRFEFDKIKIDRSFVAGQAPERQRPIIQAIVTIGRGYGMEIVAEGVETAAEFALVQSLGCTSVQGYWLSKPLPFPEAKAFLKRKAEADAVGGGTAGTLEFEDDGEPLDELAA